MGMIGRDFLGCIHRHGMRSTIAFILSVIQPAGYPYDDSIKSVTFIHGYRAGYVCRRALLGKYNGKIAME